MVIWWRPWYIYYDDCDTMRTTIATRHVWRPVYLLLLWHFIPWLQAKVVDIFHVRNYVYEDLKKYSLFNVLDCWIYWSHCLEFKILFIKL